MDKESVVYRHELFNHKRKEILSLVTTWMKLEIIILNHISQAQKDKFCMISLIGEICKVDLGEIESRIEVTTGQGE
jgi:hypothetical protein